MQDKTEGEFFLNACEHQLQDVTRLLLVVPHLGFSGAQSWPLLPFLTSSPDLGARLFGLRGVPLRPHLSEGMA